MLKSNKKRIGVDSARYIKVPPPASPAGKSGYDPYNNATRTERAIRSDADDRIRGIAGQIQSRLLDLKSFSNSKR